jgi:hypothetical protein
MIRYTQKLALTTNMYISLNFIMLSQLLPAVTSTINCLHKTIYKQLFYSIYPDFRRFGKDT